MPVGRVSYKGPLPVGKTSGPMLSGAGSVKPVAQRTSPVVQQQQDIAMAKALGLPGAKDAKIASRGRQNVSVAKSREAKGGSARVSKNGTNAAGPKGPSAVASRSGRSKPKG